MKVYLPKCSSLEELKIVLDERYAQNINKLQKVSLQDDYESNVLRSRLLGENQLITKILVAIGSH
jgi:hypothetical protein